MRKQHGFGLLEVIVGAGVLGVALATAGMYAKKQAEAEVKDNIAANVVDFVDAVKTYSRASTINNDAAGTPIFNPLNGVYDFGSTDGVFPGAIAPETAVYISDHGLTGHNRVPWLKQASCFIDFRARSATAGVHPQGIDNVPDGAIAFMSCDESLNNMGELEYVGSAFRFDVSGGARHSTSSVNFFTYSGSPASTIGDYAAEVINMANRKAVGVDVRIARITLSGTDDSEITQHDSMSYDDFLLATPEERERFLTGEGLLALSIASANHREDALLRDGSVDIMPTAGLCWDSTVGDTRPCITIDPTTNELQLSEFNSVSVTNVKADALSFKTGETSYRTPLQANYTTLQDPHNPGANGRAKEIPVIACPAVEGVNWTNQFSAVLSSFTTAGQNANFADPGKDGKTSGGTEGDPNEHALLSGITLDWELRNKGTADTTDDVWLVSADIGIEGGVLDGDRDVLSNPKSLSFITFQWCEGTAVAP